MVDTRSWMDPAQQRWGLGEVALGFLLAQALAVGAPEAALAPLEAAVAREVASALAALTARPASPTGTV